METPSEALKPAEAKPAKPRPVAPTGRFALGTASSIKKRADGSAPAEVGVPRSSLMKSTSSLNASSATRRSSTGTAGKQQDNGSSAAAKKSSPTLSDGARKTKLVSAPAAGSKPAVEKKTSLVERTGADLARKPAVKASPTSTLKKVQSKTESSNGSSGSTRRVSSNASVPSPRSVTSNAARKLGTQASSAASNRRKSSTADSRDSRFMMLPQVDLKASDEVRLDSRGHRVRSLKQLRLSHALEFVYLRDNLLSSLEGIEILKGVKVLDLSFNDFKLPGFEPLGNCVVLQQLYLAGNQITSLASLPELPNLEFLSIAQNRLKSVCMARQPRLQVLAASRNKISTLKGFPHFPSLEHLRVEENPLLEMPHLEAASILLIGPTLKKFNDRDLNPNEAEVAKQYPAHTAICIRDGWEFCSPELAADSTFSFLLEQWNNKLPQGYMVNKAYVDHPFEEDPCHCHFRFTNLGGEGELVLKYQWFLGGKTPTDFVAIPGASSEVYWPKREDVGRCLKVECTPIVNGAEFSPVFAVSLPVSPGTGCPKVINLAVSGEVVEGNILSGVPEIAWCGGTPGKGVASWLRRRWNGNAVVIDGAEGMEYQLTVNDINSSLVFMYTPVTDEGVKGEPQCTMTDFVKAATPSVSNVHVLGDIVEDNIIVGKGKYFGGREGLSKIRWFREKENGEFLLVLSDSMEYTLTKEDVGRHLKFVYIPVNLEGQEGESACAITDVVKKAPPKVFNLKIVGESMEGSKISASATVTGGTEGSSRVQWYKASSSEFKNEHELEALTPSRVSKTFRIPLGAVGYYIVAKFTPVAPDGEVGEPAYATSDGLVETLPPSLNFLTVTGEFSEGQILTASYGYIGGHEGNSLYSWHLHEAEDDEGTPLSEATGLLQYCVTKEAVGKFVSFKCTPVRDDDIVGEARSFIGKDRVTPGMPTLLSLEVTGDAIEGTTMFASKRYWGGEEGDTMFRWILTNSDGTEKEIEGATSSSYTLKCNDIGFYISVLCKPVRNDGVDGSLVSTEAIGPIIPGPPTCQSLELAGSMVEGGRLTFHAVYTGGLRGSCIQEWFRLHDDGHKDKLTADECLDLDLADIDCRIELMYTPVREDGVHGLPRSVTSDTILPGEPKGVNLILPECFEDNEISPIKTYFGGKEGTGKYTWFRNKEKLDNLEFDLVAESSEVVGETLKYKPSLNDVSSYLILYWVPTRRDGKVGDPLMAISDDPVMAAFPSVSDVHLEQKSSDVYCGLGIYYGGYEGLSLYRWYRESSDGTRLHIDGADSVTYEVTDADYSCRLLFGYTPVRSDGISGEEKLSEPSDVILPELLKIETLNFKGNQVERETLTAAEQIPYSEIQQHIWKNYKKEMKYQWFISNESGGDQSFEPLATQCSRSYKVRFEDIGRCLKCECFVTDVFGRSSELVSAVTAPILPGRPKIEKLEIEGRGFHTDLYAVQGTYSGGKEGKSKIQWLRSMVGSPDLISIPGETGRTYEANVDDVGYRLVAIYTPVREDGVEGQPVSVSTEQIAVEPELYREVKQKLDDGSVKFEVLCDKDRTPKKAQVMGHLERRVLEVNRKRIKVVKPGSKTSFPSTEVRGTYAPPFHVELYRNDQHRFKIVVDGDTEVDLMVQTRHMRDRIILTIRGLAQKFNSTSLNTLLRIES
ncbi:187-kDa microtubule-associated protein AIR9 [Zea mays]|uniref:187-kDa microtubule-associated protein AIR9 n=8 Tax=Zea mays TaxID=4577 RepID=A0A1D6HS87_MAIZE|nr:187-kDa microtubule-associated protein AIR9 [Zea mays]XP_020397039.1 187-kDa microtubule-associated protein AIR9 [Zea mays]XP_020397040.1 187-kDa microtubule-associated protein AIR9 [Zea mays]XP_035816687.1 187-kDa microtubule-associated protein AIR9 [Zea mays]ONM51303.1 187-kDa microtubule-associated protein AIR9 [Zea mays]ONM51308.1 187-kDa microtubule-associated protein AIR9 [Zea mays]ONM51314.1 187-kDa microtubule-associated protein AIR9 [Zea mays]ONM51318.1 187-kDa microtubule-associ|eukprot:XP_008652013.1 187-kDa microtubule-associated protein AIR9 [Zea mays]